MVVEGLVVCGDGGCGSRGVGSDGERSLVVVAALVWAPW